MFGGGGQSALVQGDGCHGLPAAFRRILVCTHLALALAYLAFVGFFIHHGLSFISFYLKYQKKIFILHLVFGF
jgi:hypothetical protein